jgi:hypothetical protein
MSQTNEGYHTYSYPEPSVGPLVYTRMHLVTQYSITATNLLSPLMPMSLRGIRNGKLQDRDRLLILPQVRRLRSELAKVHPIPGLQ